MSTPANNLLHVIGTHEAVAEVAMFLCQDTHVRTTGILSSSQLDQTVVMAEVGYDGGLTFQSLHRDPLLAITGRRGSVEGYGAESFGITSLPAHDGGPALVRLSVAFHSTQDARILALGLSERFPATTVGLRGIGAGDACSIEAYSAGEEVLSLDPTQIPADPDWEQRYEEADDEKSLALELELEQARDAFGLDQLIDVAQERSRVVAVPPHAGDSVTFGWPRWSLLAHAAFSDDVAGIHDALAGFDTRDEKLAALQQECRNAADRGVASWMDTALFGDPAQAAATGDNDVPQEPSYRHLHLDHYAPRQMRLLSFLATTHDASVESSEQRALADALLTSLADPDARLSSGLHPAVFLTAVVAHAQARALPESVSALEGLEKLLVELASRVPRAPGASSLEYAFSNTAPENGLNLMLCSVIAIAMQPHVVKSQIKPALGAGVPPQLLVRSVVVADRMAPDGPDYVDAAGILRLLSDSYGSATGIPSQVTDEFELIAPHLARSYEALRTAELMQAQITAAPSRAAATARRAPRA